MILFLRHGRPIPPYDQLDTLPVDELDRLALLKVDPPIMPGFFVNDVPKEVGVFLKKGARIFTSPTTRAKQTAMQALQMCQMDTDIIVDKRIREMLFTPSQLLGAESSLANLRVALYDGLMSGSPFVEPLDEILTRLTSFLDEYSEQDIVCVSHGFLLRLLQALQTTNFQKEGLREAIQSTQPVGYGELVIYEPRKISAIFPS